MPKGLPKKRKVLTAHHRQMISAGLQQRKATGLSVGAPKKIFGYWFKCQNCGTVKRNQNGQPGRKFCNKQCAGKISGENRLALSDARKIRRLYLKGKTTIEIGRMFDVSHRTVSRTLERIGCPRRRKGNLKTSQCEICKKPVYLIWNNRGRNFYGSKCKYHHLEIRRKRYAERTLQNGVNKIAQAKPA